MANHEWKVECILKGHSDSVLCLDIQNIITPARAPAPKPTGKKGKKGKGGGRGGAPKQQQQQEKEEKKPTTPFLCSGAEDGTVRLWNLETKQERGRLSLPDAVNSVVFHPIDPRCFFASSEEKIYQIAIHEPKQPSPAPETTTTENTPSSSPSPSPSSPPPHLHLTIKDTITYNSDEINQLAIHSSGEFLAAADDSGEVKVIDLRGGGGKRVFRTLRVHENICSSVHFRPSAAWEMATGGMDCTFTRSNFSTSSPLEVISTEQQDSQQPQQTTYNPPLVNNVCYSSGGEWLVAGVGDYSARLLKIQRRKAAGGGGKGKGGKGGKGEMKSLEWVMTGHLGGVTQSCFVKRGGGEEVVTAGNDAKIKFWRLPGEGSGGGELKSYGEIDHKEKVNWMVVCGMGEGEVKRLVVADVSEKITVYCLEG